MSNMERFDRRAASAVEGRTAKMVLNTIRYEYSLSKGEKIGPAN